MSAALTICEVQLEAPVVGWLTVPATVNVQQHAESANACAARPLQHASTAVSRQVLEAVACSSLCSPQHQGVHAKAGLPGSKPASHFTNSSACGSHLSLMPAAMLTASSSCSMNLPCMVCLCMSCKRNTACISYVLVMVQKTLAPSPGACKMAPQG